MRLTFSESDIDPKTQLSPAVNRAAADHIAEGQLAAGWVDPDKTRVVPASELAARRLAAIAQPAETAEEEEKEQKTFLGLSFPQVVGGVLASTTAAILGGQLGVAGTVVGAALTTIVITVSGALYTHGLSRTSSSLGAVASRFRLGGTTPLKNVPDVSSGDTELIAASDSNEPEGSTETTDRASWREKISPVKLLAAAAAIFLIAAAVVTGLEALRGESFAGGGQTTVGQIGRDGLSSGTGSSGDTDQNPGRTEPEREASRHASSPTPTPDGAQMPDRTTEPASTTQATQTTAPTTGTGSTSNDESSGSQSDTTGGGTEGSGSGTDGSSKTDPGAGTGSASTGPQPGTNTGGAPAGG